MEQQKVTRQELREMEVGQTKTFQLSDGKKVASARVTCTQMKHEEGLVFRARPDYHSKEIEITRLS